ncbi:transmembrane protein 134 [Lepeophtheirus salmonis]|uniref:Transmembrane protein 134like [Bombyx mori] n=1 Tax=Lepeophtheirus salmonis TaxID=72036 RepID=A0A0K2TJN0_LEPSM|nr:transmembrane protein 134-like [Lepeophtheirus salmonis]
MSNFRTIDEAFEVSPMDRIRLYGPLTPVEEESEPGASIAPKEIRMSSTSYNPDDTISQDSTSLIGGLYNSSQYWWNHPKIRDNWKIVLASFCLLIVGLGLIIVGVITYFLPELNGYQGVIFLMAGVICFTPGAYHIVYVYLAAKGKRGFEFRHLPLFN